MVGFVTFDLVVDILVVPGYASSSHPSRQFRVLRAPVGVQGVVIFKKSFHNLIIHKRPLLKRFVDQAVEFQNPFGDEIFYI